MKKLYTLLLFIAFALFTAGAWAQGSTVVIFSEHGEKFNVEFSGSMQSSQPEARIEIDNVFGPSFKFKVFMDGVDQGPISKTAFNKVNGSFFYVIKKDSKGKFILESTGYDWSDKVAKENATGGTEAKAAAAGGTATTKSTEEPKSTEPAKTTDQPKVTAATTGAKRWCENPVSDADFIAGYSYISNVSFDPTRMSAAKGFAGDHCLLASQVKEIVELFSMENARLDFAKFAYTHTYDTENYAVVNDAFHSKSSAESLKKYIDSKNK